ncbi:hypothetical protein ING2D1G_1313 [Peptoniphilus sp. ING2-D1G]|nr:hypothetical protein ING2D1G_1313 [Peptoniphilus sp. ING2-D1G]
MKKNIKYATIIIALIILTVIFINRSKILGRRDIVFDKTVADIEFAENFYISTNAIIIFDGDTLYFCDKNGNIAKNIKFTAENLKTYYANNYVFLYDKDLNKIYQYRDTGELINNIKIKEELYNIKYLNREIVLHLKSEGKEMLKILKQDGSLSDLYETNNFILTYDLYKTDKFSVGEILNDATGYKSLLVLIDGQNRDYKEISAEVCLFVSRKKDATIMATDKHLYLYEGEKQYRTEIPNISDILVADRNIYLLHSNIISKYNMKLEQVDKLILSANVSNLTMVSNSLYAYGESNIGGELGTKSQFYTRLGTKVDRIEISGVTIGALKEGKINLYKIINGRNFIGDENE